MLTSAPVNATEVALHLAKLARELDETVRMLQTADQESVRKRHEYDLAFSRAFVGAEGSIEGRKHNALIDTEKQRMEAEVADAVVRHLRRTLDALKTRIDVGRSFGAAVRAELALGNTGEHP